MSALLVKRRVRTAANHMKLRVRFTTEGAWEALRKVLLGAKNRTSPMMVPVIYKLTGARTLKEGGRGGLM